jgi:putative DNA primase/helicase
MSERAYEGTNLKSSQGSVGGKQRSSDNWTRDLKLKPNGSVIPILNNVILFLRHHPQLEGALAFDQFSTRVVIRKPLPWGRETLDAPWSDHHETALRAWFQRNDVHATLGDIGRAVPVVAREHSFHPVREYFDALVWDGTSRLDRGLITYFRADDTAYTRAIFRRFIISCVARIYEPGCKVDHVLVLEGQQGWRKSESLRALVPRDAWFTDRLSHVASKDAAMEMTGVMLIEIAEMDTLIRATSSSMKAFLTRSTDRFRPPYGKHPIALPRQSVFAGTINPEAGGYLKDPTGSRRIWPVTCGGVIDCRSIEGDRDQLWAEGVVLYKAGAKWHLETPELEGLATVEQARRFKVDPWRARVENWLGSRRSASIEEVLANALEIGTADQTHSHAIRVTSILTHLGFTKQRLRSGDKRQYRYARE